MPDPSLSKLAADLSKLHILLSLPDGDSQDVIDPMFEAAVKRRLNADPAQAARIAREMSKLVSA